jgi:phage baseplate assembly protein V
MLLRFGRVSELEAATARVRVAFGAEDALVSYWLPVLQQKTLSDRAYWMPDLEEHVVCLLDERGEDGVVIGAIYSEADVPPVASLDRLHVEMKDGTTFDYDRATHKLSIALTAAAADVEVSTTRNVTINSRGGSIFLNVAAAAKVYIGGKAKALRLATVEFVRLIFLTHIHPTPTGPSGPPVATGAELQAPHITQKGESE